MCSVRRRSRRLGFRWPVERTSMTTQQSKAPLPRRAASTNDAPALRRDARAERGRRQRHAAGGRDNHLGDVAERDQDLARASGPTPSTLPPERRLFSLRCPMAPQCRARGASSDDRDFPHNQAPSIADPNCGLGLTAFTSEDAPKRPLSDGAAGSASRLFGTFRERYRPVKSSQFDSTIVQVKGFQPGGDQ